MAKTTVAVRFTGDTRKLAGAISDAESKLAKFGKGAAKFGAVAGAGLLAGGAGAVALGAKVLEVGGQLESFRLKAQTVFEGSTADVKKWADANNEAFGLTDDQLVGLAAGFGDLLKPMGFTADQAADMAKDVVGLSGALSEWTGGQTSAAEVSDILAKAMLGERDGLKQLGIAISEADVQARLAAKGQEKLTGAALEQAKAVATQELIFEKSTDAQAAYAAGGNEAVRAQNRIKAAVGELQEQIADKLLPVVLRVVEWAEEQLPKALATAQEWFERMRPTLEDVWEAVQELWDTVSDVFRRIVRAVQEFVDRFRSQAGDTETQAGRLMRIVERIRDVFQSAFDAITAIVKVAVDVIGRLWSAFGDDLIRFARTAFEAVARVVDGALRAISGIFEIFAGVFSGDWSRVWDGLKETFAGIFGALAGIVQGALGAVEAVIGGAVQTIQTAWSSLWGGIGSAVRGAFDGVVNYVRSVITGVIDQVNRVIAGFNRLPGPDLPLIPGGSQSFSSTGGLTGGTLGNIGTGIGNVISGGGGVNTGGGDFATVFSKSPSASEIGQAVARALRQEPPQVRVADVTQAQRRYERATAG